ncbi:unnamed protein product, partial [Amoebophrya sp. A120]
EVFRLKHELEQNSCSSSSKASSCGAGLLEDQGQQLQEETTKYNPIVLYGTLPPEVRQKQVQKFNEICAEFYTAKVLGKNATQEPKPGCRSAARAATSSQEQHNMKIPVLIATDCIGLGVNLRIKRILFSATSKFDGNKRRKLSEDEVRQIAG